MPSQIESIILSVAEHVGVDPYLAVAIATVESDLNPRAVGDDQTSFGLYQLHQGGELGDLSEEEAFNPRTNANVALKVLASVVADHPGDARDFGTLAALAQRPADPHKYAQKVDEAVTLLANPQKTRLWRRLAIENPLQRGTDVRMLQKRLSIASGTFPGVPLTIDSVFGAHTRDAVELFQRNAGHLNIGGKDVVVTVDGIVGPQTADVLGWHWDGI